MPRYFIETMGCQMNVHDSERIAGLLERAGYEPAESAETSDLIVLNTCSVRERAEEKLFSRLGELSPAHYTGAGRPVIAVAGCVAQQEGKSVMRRAPFVDVVVGTRAIRELPHLLEQARTGHEAVIDTRAIDEVSFPLGIVRRTDPVRAYVTIVEGCNEVCAFCVVPYTRGPERMRPAAEIVAETREAADTGHPEVQLLGQIVNHYQAPDQEGCDFAGLLEQLHEIEGLRRIRFASPHPRHVSDRLIETIARLPKICRHLHLPVQSGSTRVLDAMRRRHTREEYLDLVARIRARIPGIALSTDMIVGFPGETEADFEQTLTLTREVGFHSMFSFKYSERPNTPASRRLADDLDEDEKSRRLYELQAVQRDIQWAILAREIGGEVEVLVDSHSRRDESDLSGRTSQNTIVNFPGPASWIGRVVRVRILRAGPNSLKGEPVAV